MTGAKEIRAPPSIEAMTYLNEVSSLRFPPSSSSDPALLAFLLAARDEAAEIGLEAAGDASFDFALRDTVLLLSRACRRRSCMA